ncbi:response regulator [Desulfosoma caldarium]|uniref:Response regulator receiver domain-containing protein n=1 Tax=Desulfosoma caldarium TaxID=610254 RepID=A0A3N1UQQ8_9BACT|nr:response regulator [Desulfosoma caldarium]ROQ90211.1 response regulator receiver domain-containing protein [Desulfosoma caldarium]
MSAVAERVQTMNKATPHILLMEDELHVAKGLEMVLSEEGYEVDCAVTGRSALEKIAQKPFDLLVADLKLPDMNGLDVIRQVKGRRPQTEVVVITGYSSLESAVEAMKIGARDYLPKPFSEEEFKKSISEALKERLEALTKGLAQPEADRESELIERREVMRVLNRAADDKTFWRQLMEKGPEALSEYKLSPEAKAAIFSGDLAWINEHIGELTQKQLLFLHSRLEMGLW